MTEPEYAAESRRGTWIMALIAVILIVAGGFIYHYRGYILQQSGQPQAPRFNFAAVSDITTPAATMRDPKHFDKSRGQTRYVLFLYADTKQKDSAAIKLMGNEHFPLPDSGAFETLRQQLHDQAGVDASVNAAADVLTYKPLDSDADLQKAGERVREVLQKHFGAPLSLPAL